MATCTNCRRPVFFAVTATVREGALSEQGTALLHSDTGDEACEGRQLPGWRRR